MKKANLLKRTALSVLISSAIATGVQAAGSSFLDFSSVTDITSGINFTQEFNQQNIFNNHSGTITFRVKANADGFSNLLGVSDSNSNVRYVSFYMTKDSGGEVFGMEVRDNTNLIHNNNLKTAKLAPSADGYRTITYTIDQANQRFKIYIDGVLQKEHNESKFFSDIPGLNTATLGSLTRQSSNYSSNTFRGGIYGAEATTEVLTDDQVRQLHQELSNKVTINLQKEAERLAHLVVKREQMGAVMSPKYEIFKPGQGGAASYRIPGLLTTKDGVVIAAIDKRNQHANDWGNIDLAIRRSLDGGKTWEADQVIVDLAEQTYGNLGAAESALVIDAVMVQNKENGRISLIFDMFPESQALFGMFSNSQASFESEGNGHVNVDGKWYRLITDNTTGERFTVREGGIVYDRLGEAQPYKIVVEGDKNIAFKDLGNIINLNTNQVEGNIYLRSKKTGHNSGRFNAHYTSYLWMIHSDDNGATWSSPVDITTQVKADWMRFLGTGPGTGIQLKNGNLVIPVYYTNRDNKQSAAVIVSKDGGKTWERGQSPNDAYLDEIGGSRYLNTNDYEITESQVVEMNNGEIKMFSRNRSGAVIISTSRDGGMTWDKGARLREAALLDPYSQMSVIHYSKLIDGKEYLVFANPHASSNPRRNGMAWLGEVQEDGSILWKYNTTIETGSYAYNSLTELPNGDIGLLYEQVQGVNVKYVSFNLQELLWKDNFIYRDSRNKEDALKNVSYNSLADEVFYKIGDGEMIKVGEGINPASLEVREGIATLNQTANAAGEKQAYAVVTVKSGATLRMSDEDQINLSNVTLESDSNFDLNGRNFNIAEKNGTEATGLRGATIAGNIINTASTAATLTYGLNGEHGISGQLGDEQGELNLNYNPTATDSVFTLNGESKLNAVNVSKGKLVYTENAHQAGKITVTDNGNLELKDNAALTADEIAVAQGSNVILNQAAGKYVEYAVKTTGEGGLVKSGNGSVKATGDFAYTGLTDIQSGTFDLNGSIAGAVNVASQAVLAGQGSIAGEVTLKEGSVVSPSLFVANPSAFEGKTLTLNNVTNEGASFLLTVNNDSDNIAAWKHDQLLINGQLNSEKDIPVNIQLLGFNKGSSDTNSNNRYDANEGISLIQVKNMEDFRHLKLNDIRSNERSGALYPLTVVRVEAGASVATENRVDNTPNADFYDFRLQNLQITPNGTALDPTIYANNSNPVPVSRNAVVARVPSYIVANTALYNQGKQIQDTFLDNVWKEGKKGFYAIQSHTNSEYQSNRSFVQYGYDYKAKQNSTIFGGYVPLGQNTELHSAVAFSTHTVEPKAVDGESKAKYKTVSGLVSLNNKWDNVLFNLGVGYHRHSGKVSTNELDNAAKVKSNQTQVFTQAGYEINLGKFSITPMVGLSYQHLNTKIDDVLDSWNVKTNKYNVFTQQVGSNFTWKGAAVSFNLGAFYENVADNNATVHISPQANQTDSFVAGKLGNNMLLKASSDFNLLPNLTLGVQVSHRHALSDAKLKQTNLSGKIEYKF